MTETQAPLQASVAEALTVNLQSIRLTNEQFYRLCEDNPELRLELTAQGELIAMSPTGSKTGLRNAALIRQLGEWAKKDGRGVTFDSSAGFSLPNGAKRSPDASWMRKERWERLSNKEQEVFAPVCPDFVVELRSPRDRIETLQAKMSEYLDNGAQLGWLVDPIEKRLYVYRAGEPTQCLEDPKSVEGGTMPRGFVLDLSELW